jgi:hypothetical protein
MIVSEVGEYLETAESIACGWGRAADPSGFKTGDAWLGERVDIEKWVQAQNRKAGGK